MKIEIALYLHDGQLLTHAFATLMEGKHYWHCLVNPELYYKHSI